MAKFRNIKTLQKFASVQVSIRGHVNQNRTLYRRDTFKQMRSTALAKWSQQLAALRFLRQLFDDCPHLVDSA